jgi:hypothetical protein
MSPEAQRIAIAEVFGLDIIYDPAGPSDRPDAWQTAYFTPSAAEQRRKRWPFSFVVKIIPDYLNDLNAMHEAEASLTDEQHSAFRKHLASVVGERESPSYSTPGWRRRYVSSTAAQRAEAFLRTIGKWEDGR